MDDDLLLLHQFRADVPEPDPLVLHRVRRRLTQHGTTPPRPGRQRGARRWGAGRIAVAATLAAVVAGSAIAVDAVTRDGQPIGASATAAELLEQAAAAAARSAPLVPPRAGQFLYRREIGGQAAGSGRGTVRRPIHLCGSVHETWTPADPGEDAYIVRYDGVRIGPGNTDPATLPRDRACSFDSRGPENVGKPSGSYSNPTPTFVAGLPTTPQALYARIRAEVAEYRTGPKAALANDEILTTLLDLLSWRSPFVPPELTAAAFRAVALVPGVELTGTGKDILGRSGTVVGRTEPARGTRREIVFEPETGRMLGHRETFTAAQEGFRAGDVFWQSAITSGVVGRVGERPRG